MTIQIRLFPFRHQKKDRKKKEPVVDLAEPVIDPVGKKRWRRCSDRKKEQRLHERSFAIKFASRYELCVPDSCICDNYRKTSIDNWERYDRDCGYDLLPHPKHSVPPEGEFLH